MVALLCQHLLSPEGKFQKNVKNHPETNKKIRAFLAGSETLIFYFENFYCLIIS